MNRNSLIKVVFLASIVLFLHPQHIGATTFTRNLTQGTRGEDVRTLQKVLNLFPETRIANTGAGSPGKETTLFGAGTKKALIKFQNLHKKDILDPLGLSKAPGYAGTYTIRKIESFLPMIGILPTPLPSEIETPVETVDLRPVITSLSVSPLTPLLSGEPTKTNDGEYVFDNTNTVILTGKNFTKNNTVFFTREKPMEKLVSADGTTLTFTFNSTITASLKASFGGASESHKLEAINGVSNSLAEKSTDPKLVNGIFMKMSLYVENENGMSAPIPIVVNLAKGI
ncbi:MAG: peptidoglycan-binding protein [Candidatus Pacebacteria bacterium]|nr:peptidoglycan-binding protein [Candidatus Paceibacterota bacterium]